MTDQEVQLFLADLPAGAIAVAAAADSSGDAYLAVLAGTRKAGGDLDQWVKDLDRSRLIRQR